MVQLHNGLLCCCFCAAAFRMEYLKQLDKFFVSSAMQLADILHNTATAAAADPLCSSSSPSSNSDRALDFQRMFRLMTLDSIGLTSMQYDFAAMRTWKEQQSQQPQQQQQQPTGAHGMQRTVLIEQQLQDLSKAFVWQSLCLPVPRESMLRFAALCLLG
jgi:hypothetical protein